MNSRVSKTSRIAQERTTFKACWYEADEESASSVPEEAKVTRLLYKTGVLGLRV